MRLIKTCALICCLGITPVAATAAADVNAKAEPPAAAQGRIKRVALRVPNLDQGIVFFRDVIGFRLEGQFTMAPGADPYLPLIFSFEHTQPLRMALFSTATEPRGLFLVETPDMQTPTTEDPVNQVMVLETPDIAALRARAEQEGFFTAEPQEDTTPDGVRFSEMLVIGPGGHRAVVFQYFDD